ncbi:hypothetical protein PTKIN_Ptkin06aG0036900 [Pterospermum kingtungense]
MLAASSMEKTPISSSSQIQLPPGFRFHPSDEELIVHYLKNRVNSNPLPASIIAEIDLYKYNPWELPDKALFGEDEWYFFSPRERKYPNGARPNRAAGSGYWKATGTDKPILTSCGTKSIGVKKALVFYKGRPPKGTKTDWIMHEYRLLETMIWTPKRKGSMRLDDWVLCRVREKSSIQRNNWEGHINLTSHEPDSYNLPKLNELWPSNENQSIDMAKSYLFNDFPLLPYIFTSQGPFLDTTSSITPIQEANNSDHKKNLQISFTETLFNPSKRKSMEGGNQVTSFVIPSKKLEKEDRKKEEVISVSNDCSDMNLYGTDHSECNNFSPDQWNSIMQYQELNLLDFTETD